MLKDYPDEQAAIRAINELVLERSRGAPCDRPSDDFGGRSVELSARSAVNSVHDLRAGVSQALHRARGRDCQRRSPAFAQRNSTGARHWSTLGLHLREKRKRDAAGSKRRDSRHEHE